MPTGKVIAKNAKICLRFASAALFWIILQAMFRRTDAHMDTRIIFIFAHVVFLGVSYMTYCREMIDTKNALRQRVKLIQFSDWVEISV
jgi:predicted branched-subunit amino acid permease